MLLRSVFLRNKKENQTKKMKLHFYKQIQGHDIFLLRENAFICIYCLKF